MAISLSGKELITACQKSAVNRTNGLDGKRAAKQAASSSLSNGDLSGLLTAQNDRPRKARWPSVSGKGAAMVSADRIGSGCNLPTRLTQVFGPRYEDWKGSSGLRSARTFKRRIASRPGQGRPHPESSPVETSAGACTQGSLPPWLPSLVLLLDL